MPKVDVFVTHVTILSRSKAQVKFSSSHSSNKDFRTVASSVASSKNRVIVMTDKQTEIRTDRQRDTHTQRQSNGHGKNLTSRKVIKLYFPYRLNTSAF
jgi:hypothetical protein